MVKFTSKEELINSYAQMMHEGNLNEGGVFDLEGNRVSDLEREIEDAAEMVTFIGAPYIKMVTNIPEKINAWYIKGYGYCEATR